ncbi:MAG TPA: SGNH/GDSL hydrolase family protein [Thermodesulfobacteriota bacterium]|nr:SGNH/GDSL hydrolase family protein [Thermodesulfobacteriota bacterium]
MKIRLKKKLFFLFVLIVILGFMNVWLDRELNPHYPLQYSEVFHPKVNANMIILGASHATHGINPRYFDRDHLRVFNFSLNGAGPSFNLEWYRKIFRPNYPKPLYVIYGVHWGMFDENLLKRKFDNDSKYFPRHLLFNEFSYLEALKILILNQFAFIRERKQLLPRIYGRQPEVFVASRYYHGFIPYERKGGLEKKKDVKPKNSGAQIRAFEELLDELEKNKIEVIFVQAPGYLPARDDSNIEEGMKLLNRIAEERKIPFLDYDTKRITNINTDPSMFSDWLHLNEKGSDAFSKLLRGDLESVLKEKSAEASRSSIPKRL